MHPRFQRDPTVRHRAEYFSHRLRRRAEFLFQNHLPGLHLVRNTNSRGRPGPSRWSVSAVRFLLCCAATVLTLFIAGLLLICAASTR